MLNIYFTWVTDVQRWEKAKKDLDNSDISFIPNNIDYPFLQNAVSWAKFFQDAGKTKKDVQLNIVVHPSQPLTKEQDEQIEKQKEQFIRECRNNKVDNLHIGKLIDYKGNHGGLFKKINESKLLGVKIDLAKMLLTFYPSEQNVANALAMDFDVMPVKGREQDILDLVDNPTANGNFAIHLEGEDYSRGLYTNAKLDNAIIYSACPRNAIIQKMIDEALKLELEGKAVDTCWDFYFTNPLEGQIEGQIKNTIRNKDTCCITKINYPTAAKSFPVSQFFKAKRGGSWQEVSRIYQLSNNTINFNKGLEVAEAILKYVQPQKDQILFMRESDLQIFDATKDEGIYTNNSQKKAVDKSNSNLNTSEAISCENFGKLPEEIDLSESVDREGGEQKAFHDGRNTQTFLAEDQGNSPKKVATETVVESQNNVELIHVGRCSKLSCSREEKTDLNIKSSISLPANQRSLLNNQAFDVRASKPAPEDTKTSDKAAVLDNQNKSSSQSKTKSFVTQVWDNLRRLSICKIPIIGVIIAVISFPFAMVYYSKKHSKTQSSIPEAEQSIETSHKVNHIQLSKNEEITR